jgi:3-isopropylmalate dehydratase small subunit
MFEGNAWVFGDDVDTDVIIPAKYLVTWDPATLAARCFEGVDPSLAARIAPGDIVIAGKNFGCGSSREHAAIAMKGLGISCAIAVSYGQIFYRNSFNLGIPLLEADIPAGAIRTGDRLTVDLSSGAVCNLSGGAAFTAAPIPGFMRELIAAGGLMPYVEREAPGGVS